MSLKRILARIPLYARLLIAAALSGALLIFLYFEGVLIWNEPSKDDYPISGVDVSSYQGEIDWAVLAAEGIDFAFIKATEGSTYTDRCFETNLEGALATSLRVGAYHFFSYDSSGETQAEHFIEVVPKVEGMLPPVVDVEFYGDYFDAPADKEDVLPELSAFIDALEAHYGVKPIIYVTDKAYELYIAGEFPENDIWFRDILSSPSLSDGREPTFWQYSNRARLEGYEGEERFIDMNVFCGNREEFRNYPQ